MSTEEPSMVRNVWKACNSGDGCRCSGSAQGGAGGERLRRPVGRPVRGGGRSRSAAEPCCPAAHQQDPQRPGRRLRDAVADCKYRRTEGEGEQGC